jgi:hypothetical protein
MLVTCVAHDLVVTGIYNKVSAVVARINLKSHAVIYAQKYADVLIMIDRTAGPVGYTSTQC